MSETIVKCTIADIIVMLLLVTAGAIAGFAFSVGLAVVFQTFTPIIWGWPVGVGIGSLLGILTIISNRRTADW